MQLRNPVFCWLALFLTTFIPNFLHAQDADLEDPLDTSGIMLTAKGEAALTTLTEEDLVERLAQMTGCVDMRATGVVKGYIKTYIQLKQEKARTMLGRRLTFFPIFEAKLKEYGLPSDLKYLSVVESALNPKAVSRVGATGLWQFMPSTGSEYGLRTNSAVEDRSNPVKSTDAAMRYLKELYREFDDWALALAAYNSGPNRVNSAIRKAGSRSFWSIERFLPKETRNYVPAFIAASYICNFYQMHGIKPNNPDLDEQLTDYLLVFDGLSFRDIADATGIDYNVIKNLNPGFKRDYVPPTADGSYVILPQRVMPAFVRYLNTLSSRAYNLENNDNYVNSDMGDGRYWQTTATAQKLESLDQFAQKFGVSGDHIKTWNKLKTNYVDAGQELDIWHPVYVQRHSGLKIEAPKQEKSKSSAPRAKKMDDLSASLPKNTGINEPVRAASDKKVQETPKIVQYQYHTVKRNESLEDVARQYATSVESLRKINGTDAIRFGMRLKIRQF
ncbi:MAG: transglycosylase SLT domain-containing protein [Bacteroidota bacterium]